MANTGDSRSPRLGQPKARLAGRIEALEGRLAAADARGAALAEAIENIPEGFALFDAGQRMVICNRACKTLFGYADGEAAPGVSFDGLSLFIDRDKLSKAGKAATIAALKAALSRLED